MIRKLKHNLPIISLIFAVFMLVIMIICTLFSHRAHANSAEPACKKVEVVFARGSGRSLMADKNPESNRFFLDLNKRLKSTLSPNYYELGTKAYKGNQYPAVDIDPANGGLWTALGAYVSSGLGGEYGKSVFKGTDELVAYMNQRYAKCKAHGSYFVLGGFSQGAQVVGQALIMLSEKVRKEIKFVGLFGDPRVHFPHGGILFPKACAGNFEPYRAVMGNCHTTDGRLGARKPYLPTDMHHKTKVWCYADDFICGASQFPKDKGHDAYAISGLGISWAAQMAAENIQLAIKNEPKPTPPKNPSPNPTPTPPPPPAPLIDTKYHFGMGLNGQDVVYLIDNSYNMYPHLAKIRQNLKTTIPKIIAKGGRVALFLYSGFAPQAGGLPFGVLSSNTATNNMYIDTYVQSSFGIIQGTSLSPLNSAMQTLQWNYGAAKSIILLTNNPSGSPDTFGTTKQAVSRTSLAIDPVNIYPVVPQEYESEYTELADLTSGHVTTFTDDDDVETAMDGAFDKTQNRPVPFLKNTEYLADIGQEVTFDASDSYVIDAEITKYDWDFDGDGVFEATTTEPVINHTYNALFDGLMQVRVTASNGLVANMSAIVKIGTYVMPVFAGAPENLNAKVIKTVDGISHVELIWDSVQDENTASLALSVNGIIIGTMTRDRTSIIVTDIDRSFDNDFGVVGLDSDGKIGKSIYATVAMIPEKPAVLGVQTSHWSASNDESYAVATNNYDIRKNLDPSNVAVVRSGNNVAWYWLFVPALILIIGAIWKFRLRTTD